MGEPAASSAFFELMAEMHHNVHCNMSVCFLFIKET